MCDEYMLYIAVSKRDSMEYFAMKQGVNYIIGVVLLLLVASIDLDQLQNYLGSFILLGLLHLFF